MWRFGVLFFLAGILTALAINSLNNLWYAVPISSLLLLFFYRRLIFCYFMVSFAAGFCWLCLALQHYVAGQLPPDLENKPITVQGVIVSVPEYQANIVSVVLQTDIMSNHEKHSVKFKLDWYNYHHHFTEMHPGEEWQFRVKLKRPHGLMNPGSFDYVVWLAQEHIAATGYILDGKKIIDHDFLAWNAKVRDRINLQLKHLLFNQPLENFIAALTIGVRENMTAEQWQILQNTGTNHLIAIAGLHIGCITGLIFWCVSFLWKRLGKLPLWLATPKIAAIIALWVGWIYAALAGFSLPTERAVIMLTVFMLSTVFSKIILPWTGWCLALFIVLFCNPLSVLSAGFWLSFLAVALIIYVVTARVGHYDRYWRLTKIQFALALGLLPITWLFFQNGSLIAPLANILVIPIVGFLTVPLSLLGVFIAFFSVTLAHPILLAALVTMHWAWGILTYLAYQPGFAYPMSIQLWQAIMVFIGVIIILAPRGIPGRWLAIIFFLPLFFLTPVRPAYAQVKLTVLDVGQGLSAVIQTQHHILIYDTGARYSVDYDMGSAVVVPYLHYYHIKKIDSIVISHGDNDHIGGLQSLLRAYPSTRVLTSVPQRIAQSIECLAGQEWQWDGVTFKILYPDKMHLNLDNNSSCVLQVSTGSQAILLTGDIEKLAEKVLLEQKTMSLKATILVAPHHGSKTSSSTEFVAHVSPAFVVFATGYLNRFHFPSTQTRLRYQKISAQLYNTATAGGVNFILTPRGVVQPILSYCYIMPLAILRRCVNI